MISLAQEFDTSHILEYRIRGVSEEELLQTLIIHFGNPEDIPDMPDDTTLRAYVLHYLLNKYPFPENNIFNRLFHNAVNCVRRILNIDIPLTTKQKNYFAFLSSLLFGRDLFVIIPEYCRTMNDIINSYGVWRYVKDVKTGDVLCAAVFDVTDTPDVNFVFIIDSARISAIDFFKLAEMSNTENGDKILQLVKK